MSCLSLTGNYDSARLSNNLFPKRCPRISAMLDTIAALNGTKTQARFFIAKEMQAIVVNQAILGRKIEQAAVATLNRGNSYVR